MPKITKAVIAAAGYGTRFLPATKNQPKEMLPLIDKPIIHYIVEEAVAAGIKDIIIVTRSGQMSLEDYFDSHPELENQLKQAGKTERLKKIRRLPEMANFVYIRQHNHYPYGNATPLLCAAPLIDDDEAFVYMFGDDITVSDVPVTKQLIDVFSKQKPKAIFAVQEVPDEEVERYGTVRYKKDAEYKYEIEAAYEKLPKEKAPSNMAQFGRFVFNYDVIREVEKTKTGKDDELWIMDTLNNLAEKGKKVIAQPVKGEWFTTGDPLRYLQTSVELAIQKDDIAPAFKKYLKNLHQEGKLD